MELFFRDYDRIDQPTRTKLYEAPMRRLHEHYPNDSEAAIFYALALNEAVDMKYKTFSKQMEAARRLRREHYRYRSPNLCMPCGRNNRSGASPMKPQPFSIHILNSVPSAPNS
jgi:hypothetical protein